MVNVGGSRCIADRAGPRLASENCLVLMAAQPVFGPDCAPAHIRYPRSLPRRFASPEVDIRGVEACAAGCFAAFPVTVRPALARRYRPLAHVHNLSNSATLRSMKRDKQIFVRVTQDVYDYVAEQSERTGMTHGHIAALILAEAKGQGWSLAPGRVAHAPRGGGVMPAT